MISYRSEDKATDGSHKNQLYFFKLQPSHKPYKAECMSAMLELMTLFAEDDSLVPGMLDTYDYPDGKLTKITVRAFDGFVSLKDSPLTDEDLLKPAILTSLINTSLFRILLGDDDVTPYNLGRCASAPNRVCSEVSEFGFYHILAYMQPVWLTLRPATRKRLSAYDIENFPDISHENAPFFWLTTEPYTNPDKRMRSKNSFTIEEMEKIKNIKSNPVVIYQKFKDLLKFLITSDHVIQASLEKYIRPEFTVTDKAGETRCILSSMMEDIISYKKHLLDTLIKMKSFQDFLVNDGHRACFEIIDQYRQRNIVAEEIAQTYAKIFNSTMEHAINELRQCTSFTQRP